MIHDVITLQFYSLVSDVLCCSELTSKNIFERPPFSLQKLLNSTIFVNKKGQN